MRLSVDSSSCYWRCGRWVAFHLSNTAKAALVDVLFDGPGGSADFEGMPRLMALSFWLPVKTWSFALHPLLFGPIG